MGEELSRSEAEAHLRALARKADDVVGTHIRGVTLGHDDLRKLSSSVRVLLGQESETGAEK